MLLSLIFKPSFSGITSAALNPVTMALADVQTHLHTLSDYLTGSFVRFGPLKPGLWLARKWLGRITQDRGPGRHTLKRTHVRA